MSRRIRQVAFLFAVVFSLQHAVAGPPALTIEDGSSTTTQQDWVAGWRFDVNTDIMVDGLGVWDDEGDGLNESHEVGIWTEAGVLVTSATMPSGAAMPLVDDFRIISISPTLLTGGNRYRIGAYYSPTNDDGIVTALATTSTISEITYLDRAFLETTGGFTFPTGFNSAVLAANFGPTFTVVPEPSSLLLSLSLACMGFLRHNIRRRA